MASADVQARFLHDVHHGPLRSVLEVVQKRDPDQPEFLNAVKEVAQMLVPVFERQPELLPVFQQLCEPERQIVFRVPWVDDQGCLQVNRGFRVQFSSAIGPYKGGLRLKDGLNLSIVKSLGFEQCFKNALTTLPMGAGKGGSDFDPKGKSTGEVQCFCMSFMTELWRHIGQRIDIPAGDIGCGPAELGLMFGHYKRITGQFAGALTGKGLQFGGSEVRPEATGWGVVFFAECVLADAGEEIKGKRCIVSGSGNVALHCAGKLVEEGAVVLTLSDSKGYVFEPEGFTPDQLDQIIQLKAGHNGRLADYRSDTCRYVEGRRPWEIEAHIDMALPCATQARGEIGLEDAQQLVEHGCRYVLEGANLPCDAAAVRFFEQQGVTFGPGKAANGGGVAVSGLELAQDRLGLYWSREEVCEKLRSIMRQIYRSCRDAADEYNVSLAAGANIAGFTKVAEALLAQGAV